MGYNTGKITIFVRTDNHLGPETWLDRDAEERLKAAIDMLIVSDLDFSRIADLCTGGSF